MSSLQRQRVLGNFESHIYKQALKNSGSELALALSGLYSGSIMLSVSEKFVKSSLLRCHFSNMLEGSAPVILYS